MISIARAPAESLMRLKEELKDEIRLKFSEIVFPGMRYSHLKASRPGDISSNTDCGQFSLHHRYCGNDGDAEVFWSSNAEEYGSWTTHWPATTSPSSISTCTTSCSKPSSITPSRSSKGQSTSAPSDLVPMKPVAMDEEDSNLEE